MIYPQRIYSVNRLEALKAHWLMEQEELLLSAADGDYAPGLSVLDRVARLELNIAAITRVIDKRKSLDADQLFPKAKAPAEAAWGMAPPNWRLGSADLSRHWRSSDWSRMVIGNSRL